jgi:hypothetical protein
VSRTAFQCAAGLKPEDRPSRGHNPHQPAKPAAAVGSTSFLHNDETRQDFAGVLSLAVLKVKDVDDLRGKKLIVFSAAQAWSDRLRLGANVSKMWDQMC